jgi:hypothetical protein
VSRPLGLVPHLFVRDVDQAHGAAGRTVLFLEPAVGDARLLVSQEIAALDAPAPSTIGGTPMLLTLETTDPDDLARRAVFAGATVRHRWALTTKREQYTRRTSTRANRTRSSGARAPSGRSLRLPARASSRLRRRPT